MLIDANAVHETFLRCLFRDGEDTTGHVAAQGVMAHVGFHPTRLGDAAPQIRAWLDALPSTFRVDGGGGWSFLNACQDRDGEQWTGLHSTVDELLTMGIAIDYARILVPREFWAVFPGGMPYFSVVATPGAPRP